MLLSQFVLIKHAFAVTVDIANSTVSRLDKLCFLLPCTNFGRLNFGITPEGRVEIYSSQLCRPIYRYCKLNSSICSWVHSVLLIPQIRRTAGAHASMMGRIRAQGAQRGRATGQGGGGGVGGVQGIVPLRLGKGGEGEAGVEEMAGVKRWVR